MIATNAIPTVYRHTHFRSRLEAKWAAFFDICQWPWEYEPFDLNGYIPDFVLKFHNPVLVEVKPFLSLDTIPPLAKSKIDASGWGGDALIVGACLPESKTWQDARVIGLMRQMQSDDPTEQDGSESPNWDAACMQVCRACKSISFFHESGSYACAVKGCYDGTHLLDPMDRTKIHKMWNYVSGLVQWKAKR